MKFNSLINVPPGKFAKDALKSLLPIAVLLGIGPFLYQDQYFFFLLAVLMVATNALNIVYGYTGYLPFGFAVFLAFGAYVTAMSINLLQMTYLPALLLGGLASVGLSLLFTPLLRLSGA